MIHFGFWLVCFMKFENFELLLLAEYIFLSLYVFLHLAATKMRYFSELKLGISIPMRGESSDLLNADGEKNDYDW